MTAADTLNRIVCRACFAALILVTSTTLMAADQNQATASKQKASSQKTASSFSSKSSSSSQDSNGTRPATAEAATNGHPSSVAAFQKMVRDMQLRNGFPTTNGANARNFEGVININGKEFRTRDPAEFARLQQQMPQFPQGFPGVAQANAGNTAFQGVMNINGREFRTSNPAEFARLQRQMQMQMQFRNGFPGVVQANAGNAAFQGVMNINGREFRSNDPAEFARLQRQFANQFPALPQLNAANTNSASSFSGMINNNGNVQTFNNADAFRQAQQLLNQAQRLD